MADLPEQYFQTKDKALLPLLPPYRPGKFDYYCPGGCAGRCTHKRLTVEQAHAQCKEDYARTGEQLYLDQALAYLEYMSGQ